jgi:hypothetical protein
MARKTYVQIGLELIDKEDHEALQRARRSGGHSPGFTIVPDLPDFVSPIDGKRYSGRAGLREHCATHNVVPVADLAGLPPKPAHQLPTYTKREVEARRENLARIIDNYRR